MVVAYIDDVVVDKTDIGMVDAGVVVTADMITAGHTNMTLG